MTAAIHLIFITQINCVMVQVKEVTKEYHDDYERYINNTIRKQTEAGWKLIDIKHSVSVNDYYAKVFSALLIFDDSPTTDIPTSLNQ